MLNVGMGTSINGMLAIGMWTSIERLGTSTSYIYYYFGRGGGGEVLEAVCCVWGK